MPHPVRLRILVGCEGESEGGYTAFLNRLARDARHPVYLQAQILKGGDPLAMLTWLEDWISREEDRRGPFDYRFALIDTDRDALSPDRAHQARQLAQRIGVNVAWQVPVHEAMLLRHFEGQTTKAPPDAPSSLQMLQKIWKDYRKGLPALGYARVLTEAHLVRVSEVEPALKQLLKSARLVEP